MSSSLRLQDRLAFGNFWGGLTRGGGKKMEENLLCRRAVVGLEVQRRLHLQTVRGAVGRVLGLLVSAL